MTADNPLGPTDEEADRYYDAINDTPQTAADVVGQAARVMHLTVCCPCDPQGCDVSEVAELGYARALADAGLLADPADRDAENEAFTWRARALHWKADKERAEAEVAELRATVERVRALADEWKDLRFHQPKTDFSRGVKAQIDECHQELVAALDGGEQP